MPTRSDLQTEGTGPSRPEAGPADGGLGGLLTGISVLELGGANGEFCGKLLAGAGADVIRVEPYGGSETRQWAPFYGDRPGTERSLHFWQYNLGKRSITLDLEAPEDRQRFGALAATADVVLDASPPGHLDRLGLGYGTLAADNPGLVMASITPFGQHGPFRDWKGSDLVHLALGGVAMLTGYEPGSADGEPVAPIVPQRLHSLHMAGSLACIAILAALLARKATGAGDFIDLSIHRAVNYNTLEDMAYWLFHRRGLIRQEGRYAFPTVLPDPLFETKDGRYLVAYHFKASHYASLLRLLEDQGVVASQRAHELGARAAASDVAAIHELEGLARQWVADAPYDADLWKLGQAYRLNWAPLRRPEENLEDRHWWERGTLVRLPCGEEDRELVYCNQPWLSATVPWTREGRVPVLGEHNEEVARELREGARQRTPARPAPARPVPGRFPLEGIRVLDLTWIVGGPGGTRFLAALGAEDIRVEWRDSPDNLRVMGAVIPRGEEAVRVRAGESLEPTRVDRNQGGLFSELNAGKLGISLNLKHPDGRELFRRLVRISDVVVENFTATKLEELGCSYADMVQENPGIIYVQQPGFGRTGSYKDFVSTSPVAEAITGLTLQAGRAGDRPCGWGYPFLDVNASYFCAMAILSALHYRDRTGKGQHIDCSLADPGLYLAGSTLLDFQSNARVTEPLGNVARRHGPAPEGIYPCRGHDRWIAISATDQEAWSSLVRVLSSTVLDDARFATPEARVDHRQDLDDQLGRITAAWDPYELMHALQRAGVAAGVCQTAEDRAVRDRQLLADEVLVTKENPEIGEWPLRNVPFRFGHSRVDAGGRMGRGFPSYGEDNDHVYGTLLGLSPDELGALVADGVI